MRTGWTEVALGDIATFANGAAFKEADWSEDGARIIRIQNLTDSSKPFNRTHRTVKPELYVEPGDLLVSWSATLGVFVWDGPDTAVLNQHIFRVIPDDSSVDRSYLRHMLGGAVKQMERLTHGATMKHINRKEFLGTSIPLAPFKEQKRIASILDKADELRAKRRAAIAHLDSLTQAIFLDMFGDPVRNPMRWPTMPIGDIAEVQIGPFGSLLHSSDYTSGGVPLINPMHIFDGRLAPRDDQTVEREAAQRLARYALQPGDIVLGRRGEMGRCALVPPDAPALLCGSGSMIVRPDSGRLSGRYLSTLLSSAALKRKLEQGALGVTMMNLNATTVKQLEAIVPPLDAQRAFERAALQVDCSRRHMRSATCHLISARNSLQARAFRGEL